MAQYISKSALVAEIKKRIKGVNRLISIVGNDKDEFFIESRLIEKIHTYEDLLDYIDTIKVKELDLHEEE